MPWGRPWTFSTSLRLFTCSHPLLPATLPTTRDDRRIDAGILDAAVARILASNPALWRPGAFYAFRIPDTQPPPSTIAKPSAVKMGRSNKPPRRKSEWKRKCWPQQHEWWFYFDVPDAASFKHLIHLHFQLHGAWIQPEECEFCGVKHCEKFDEALCGWKAGVIAVVRFYLVHLGWPVTMYNMRKYWRDEISPKRVDAPPHKRGCLQSTPVLGFALRARPTAPTGPTETGARPTAPAASTQTGAHPESPVAARPERPHPWIRPPRMPDRPDRLHRNRGASDRPRCVPHLLYTNAGRAQSAPVLGFALHARPTALTGSTEMGARRTAPVASPTSSIRTRGMPRAPPPLDSLSAHAQPPRPAPQKRGHVGPPPPPPHKRGRVQSAPVASPIASIRTGGAPRAPPSWIRPPRMLDRPDRLHTNEGASRAPCTPHPARGPLFPFHCTIVCSGASTARAAPAQHTWNPPASSDRQSSKSDTFAAPPRNFLKGTYFCRRQGREPRVIEYFGFVDARS
ncbi:hypothetical protein B0H17DRAFT_1147865 [Mycena rosella]|uniref:Bacteriophage T5 Orf172 DNA-binding domain-containing protein n=1 Tax=Mycena rosella TaxID=1033263 RepID=A0AAD7CHH3_MYCRO|nr:hypothetical protein B0H17DRAFT_1147865 [Mycena rosella]